MINSIALLISGSLLCASPIKSDEQVILFPTAARFDAEQNAWVGEIHGWIFEPEEDSEWRGEVVESLIEAAELDRVDWDPDLLRSRVMPFLADNESGKRIDVRIADQLVHCRASAANGHFFGDFSLPRATVAADEKRLEASIVLDEDDERRFLGEVFLIPDEGISVVSDLDDTIKESNVLDKVELLRNTFARPFAPVAGMPEVYRKLADRGVAFHYVSASPWQLYEPLDRFRREEKFPPGTFDMKSFRVWNKSWRNLFANSYEIKTPAIERLFAEYPNRNFILIGDSGEVDPEIYGKLAIAHPEQVLGIAIRSVREGDSLSDERFRDAFRGLPEDKLLLFSSPDQLDRQIEAWAER